MTKAQISNAIDSFEGIYDYGYKSTSKGSCFSFYFKDIKYNYFYLAIHMPEGASRSSYNLLIDSYDNLSTIGAIIIILIILGCLIGLAACSLGVAKAMGRSPLDGLLCFFILCALCCCKNR